MKIIFYIFSFVIIITFLLSCHFYVDSESGTDVREIEATKQLKNTSLQEPETVQNPVGQENNLNSNYVSISDQMPTTLEEAISDSYAIVRATYLGNTPSKKTANLSYYQFRINEFLKGNFEDNIINVEIYDEWAYINDDNKKTAFYKDDEEYILFLDKFEGVYTEDSYMPAAGFLIQVKNDKFAQVVQNGELINGATIDTVDKLRLSIKSILNDPKQNGKILGCSYTVSDAPNEIVDFSSAIAKVKIIKDVSARGALVDFLSVETIEVLKGEFPQSATIIFFKEDNIAIGEEYLVMISSATSEYSNTYCLSSKNSCIPISVTDTCNEYMKYIE